MQEVFHVFCSSTLQEKEITQARVQDMVLSITGNDDTARKGI